MDRRNLFRGLIAVPVVVIVAHIMPLRALKLVNAPSIPPNQIGDSNGG